MEDKFTFRKSDKSPKEITNKYSEAYSYDLNDKNIGYALIDYSDSDSAFYLHILEEYQSNGYGSKLYQEVMNLFKRENKKAIIVKISDDNVRMNRIIKHYTHMILSHVDGVTTYQIKVQ